MKFTHLEYFADPSNPANELLQATLIELQEDDDRDVRYCSQFPDEDFECTKWPHPLAHDEPLRRQYTHTNHYLIYLFHDSNYCTQTVCHNMFDT